MITSTTSVSYCVQWFRANKCATDILTDDEARNRHARGELYTALIGGLSRPTCFLEFSAYRSVAVEFLDTALRTFCHYSFQEKEPGRLFLTRIRLPWYPDDTGRADRATCCYVKPDGHVAIEHYRAWADNRPGSYIVGGEERVVDVTNHWEPFPEFGHYDGLGRRDRGIALVDEFAQA